MTTVALFGTSADPPTVGHQAILEWLSAHYDWVAVWASDNPFKESQTSLPRRMAMLELLIEGIDAPRKNIKLQEELSYLRSLMSLKKAKEIWGNGVEYTLVIGSDLIEQIQKWYRVKELLKQVQILIFPRPGYPIQREAMAVLKELGGQYKIAALNAPAVSSTAYREQKDRTILTNSVRDYIQREQLYRCKREKSAND